MSKLLEFLNKNAVDPMDDLDGCSVNTTDRMDVRMCIIENDDKRMVFSSIVNLARYASVKYIVAYHRLRNKSVIGGYLYRFAKNSETLRLTPTEEDMDGVVGDLPGSDHNLNASDAVNQKSYTKVTKGCYVPMEQQFSRASNIAHSLSKDGVTYKFTSLQNAALYLGVTSSLLIQYYNNGRDYNGWTILREGKVSEHKELLDKLKGGEYVPYDEQFCGKNVGKGYTLVNREKVYYFKSALLAATFLGVCVSTFTLHANGKHGTTRYKGYTITKGVDVENITE